MPYYDVPLFDLVIEQNAPFPGLGETTVISDQLPGFYSAVISEASARLTEGFGIVCGAGLQTIQVVDDTISEMWDDGWNPETGDVNLFLTDFGCVVIEALRQDLSGTLVLRSDWDLSHVSLWWQQKRLEAFPFHVMYKRLTASDYDSLVSCYKCLQSIVRGRE